MTESKAAWFAMDNWSFIVACARSWSLCSSDAEDAAANTVEHFLRRYDAIDHDRLYRWLSVVARREAVRIHRKRALYTELDDRHGSHLDVLGQLVQRIDFASGMAALKPSERAALSDRAAGLTYKEIATRRRWTYTKVNRCVTEGRAALREKVAA